MKENDGVDISNYVFSTIEKAGGPLTTDQIVAPLLTGENLPDAFLKEMNIGLLNVLVEMKLIDADIPVRHGSVIRGLTAEGLTLKLAFHLLKKVTK